MAAKRNRVSTPEAPDGVCTRDEACAKEAGHKGRCGTIKRAQSDDRQWLLDQITAYTSDLHALKADRDRLKRESRHVLGRLSKVD
jgi:hypothetical protein